MVSGQALSRFPSISQVDKFRTDVTYEFDSDIDIYEIKKGPALRVFEVRSEGTTFTEGTDYSLLTDSDGNYTDIDWSVGGSSPSDGADFIIDQEYRAIIARYIEAHDEEYIDFDNDLLGILSSFQVDNASGKELDRLGKLFGQLGKRSGRNDADYRAYLKSIVESFSGRGSRAGLKFAIAAAIGGEPSDVEIIEDTDNLKYTVVINNTDTSFITGAINDLAELADPSGVEFDKALIPLEGQDLAIDATNTNIVASSTGLGGGTLTMDGTSSLG